MLFFDLKPGQSVDIGGIATITMEEKSGRSARIKFDADRSVKISRVSDDTPAKMFSRGLSKEQASV
jgi:hypothetical protein